jgi:PAS domain S-box-containing protein
MAVFLVCFMLGSLLLLAAQISLNNSFVKKRGELKEKYQTINEVNGYLTQSFLDIRGYFAYGNPSLRDHAMADEPKIRKLQAEFAKIAATKEDKQLLKDMDVFVNYYFQEILPKAIAEYEAGHPEKVTELANTESAAKVNQFRNKMSDYLQGVNQGINNNFLSLIKMKTYLQIGFVFYILLILLILYRIVRIMLRDMGQPLTQFTAAAEEIANGNGKRIRLEHKRQDEIGALSIAFEKMAEKIRQNEHDLIARNAELNLMLLKSEEERKRNQDILNSMHEGVQLMNSKGETIQINDQFCDLIGCHDKEILGMTLDQWAHYMEVLVEEEDFISKIMTVPIERKDSSHKEHSFQYTLKNPRTVIQVYSEILYHGEEMLGMVLVHRDMTREYELDQMKSEFVSTVSHELRTPLASILGFTELMLHRELKPERREKYLTTIFNESKRLTSLINDFLDIQRMESGQLAYEKKYFELQPILEKVIEMQQINTKNHTITLESEAGPLMMLGDKAKLEQVFTNLINNAIKYTPGGGEINVHACQEAGQLKVSVTDTGLGIPEESIDQLFTRFYRIDNSDRRKIGGTGLGLAIVQEIVKAHQGEIMVQSEYGKGSTFTVVFPAIEPHLDSVNGKEHSTGYQIVVVEDDQSLASLISQELWDSGFSVVCFESGQDTLNYLKQEIPDAIVLDILLNDSDYDGWKMMKELKASETLKNIPIIVSTVLDEKEKGLSLGAEDFLIKPYKPSQLSKSIMQTLLKVGKVGQILIPEE